MTLLEKILTGKTEEHLINWKNSELKIHKEMLSDLLRLEEASKTEGFSLLICSAFRSFDRQLKIWNEKATGKRKLLNREGVEVDFKKMSPNELVTTILRWSSLPGISRHHWGTDLDVADSSRVPKNYTIQLIPSEFEHTGMFSELHDWLDEHMSEFGFFRPYDKDLGGVSPERWHISYKPLSDEYYNKHSKELLKKLLLAENYELKTQIEEKLNSIFDNYFLKISLP